MRVLLIGAGRPGLELTRRLTADGHAVRFVTGDDAFAREIETAGGEAYIGDPDRIGTLRYALDNVTVLGWLLGTTPGGELHGSRLTMMMERTIDTTVRGIIYEQPDGVETGAEIVERMATYNEIPHEVLPCDRSDDGAWTDRIVASIERLVAVDRGGDPV